jgi:hypothetical protein
VTNQALLNPTDAELGVAVEENLFALFRAMSTLPGSELVETPELSYPPRLSDEPDVQGRLGHEASQRPPGRGDRRASGLVRAA